MTATPNGTTITAHTLDAGDIDITEGVKALYDLVLSSMDWGSGFWTAEDAAPVAVVARACGFGDAEEVDAYIAARTQETESAAFLHSDRYREISSRPIEWPVDSQTTTDREGNVIVVHTPRRGYQAPHDHVFSSLGRCMWPGCREGYES
jgi:hypothetical protein